MSRLDRALSKLGIASRSQAKRLIADGRVRVAGRIVRDAAHLVAPEHGSITVDGAKPPAREWRAIAFHKPKGVVTTRRDPEGRPTVFDVLGDTAESLVTVGRLDMASTGLLLLTTDTLLANYLTDPSHAIVRRYIVTVRGALDDEDAARMSEGIDGLRARSVVVRKRSARETHLVVELVEGKNREIRRMLESLGHPVTKLMRVAFGTIELGTLQPGQWREVTRAEITPSSNSRADRSSSRAAPENSRRRARSRQAAARHP
ncbi:MAG TPA: pseudouridine synthase [Vicinamibacterales bacterium]|nr:pseudouridine synthase [Vicinamibacterales bacterium]